MRELLKGVKHWTDYYQREYKRQTMQIQEMVDELEERCDLYRRLAEQVWDPADLLSDAQC